VWVEATASLTGWLYAQRNVPDDASKAKKKR